MELKDILETLEKYTSKDILAELDAQMENARNLAKASQTACDAYFADVERKEQAIAAQIEKFKANIAKIDAQIKAVQPALVVATAQGDTNGLVKIQGKLADYEAQKAAIGTQIQLLQSASIKGSNELVRIADEKDKLLSDANIAYEAAVRNVREVAKRVLKDMEHLERETRYRNGFYGSAHSRMHEHLGEYGKYQKPTPPKKKEPEMINLHTGTFTRSVWTD